MESKIRDTNRIAKNSLFLYIRMFVMLLVSLYTSRVTLQALGVEDFGIYNVLAGFVSLLGVISASLTNAVQRFLNIGLAKSDPVYTSNVFRQSFTLLVILSIALVIVAETIGLWFVVNKLVIPPEKLEAAIYVYQFTIISTLCSINYIPFIATIVAREKMGIYAYLGLFEAIAKLVIAFSILKFSGNSLILYGGLMAGLSLSVLSIYAIYCSSLFPECKLKLFWDKRIVTDMSKFIGYTMFGCVSQAVGLQGANILLNIFFGPIVNTANGIARQVNAVVNLFISNIITALKPQMIKSYQAGDKEYAVMLLYKGSKFSLLLVCLLIMPVMFETHYILKIWLGDFPDYTVIFVRILLIESFIWVMLSLLSATANATGNIKGMELYGRMISLAFVPVCYIILKIFPNPVVAIATYVIFQGLYFIYSMRNICGQLHLSKVDYLKRIVMPPMIVLMVMTIIGLAVTSYWETESMIRLIVTSSTLVVIGLVTAFAITTQEEKKFIIQFIHKKRA